MNDLFLNILDNLKEKISISILEMILCKNGYGSIEFAYRDKNYKLSLTELEEEKND